MTDSIRVDLLLDRLCVTRSRTEAKAACDAGAVRVDGQVARASRSVSPGQTVRVDFPDRMLELEILGLPGKSVSKTAARELYRVVRDEPSPAGRS